MTAPTVTIEPTAGHVLPRLREAWTARELLYFLTLRDCKVRYAQTVLGWLWAIVQPLGMTLVFTLAFRKLGNVKTDGVVYPLFALAGLSLWTFFQRAVVTGADSLVTNAPLLTKTACPRLLLPFSAVASAIVDLLVAMALLFVITLLYGHALSWRLVILPAVVVLTVALATGIAVTLSAINVRRRDVRNALPFGMQLLLFLSPIAYSLSTLGQPAETILALNPLVGIVEAFRWAVLATPPPSLLAMGLSIAITLTLLAAGTAYFARVARDFADVA
jgi:lipopolysaccharide transport system permease protein